MLLNGLKRYKSGSCVYLLCLAAEFVFVFCLLHMCGVVRLSMPFASMCSVRLRQKCFSKCRQIVDNKGKTIYNN